MSNERQPRGPWVLWAVTLLALVFLSWWGWRQLERSAANQRELSDALESASSQLGASTAARTTLEQRLREVTSERDSLAAKTNELSTTLASREEELARLQSASKSLEEKLAQEIARGEVKVTQHDGRLQVDLIDKVLFDSAKAEISPRGEEVLGRLGAILATMDRQIQISGHTDDAPITLPELKAQFATNWELSAARAVNVVRFLTEKAQVKPGRLVAAAYGPYRPVATNSTPKGRAANRRIEVLFMPELDARKTALRVTDGGTP